MRIALLIALIFCSCQSSRRAGKSDEEFDKALKESEANEKLDFLADEKLPNEEYIVTDSAAIPTDDFVEIRPERFAAFRVQIFAGTPENAFRTITDFTSRDSLKPAYVIKDSSDGLWKVWIGDCQDRKEADTLKAALIAGGYAGAWVYEMKTASATMITEEKLWWLQLGSFQSRAAAEKAMERVPAADDRRVVIREIQGSFKLRVGGYPDRTRADQLKKDFTDFKGAFVVQDL
jgi:cell division septation protein DedD